MKNSLKIIVIPVLIILTVGYINAQDCKYKVNKVDKFTKKLMQQTIPKKVISTVFIKGLFSLQKIDTSYFLILDFEESNSEKISSINIDSSAQLIFILENKGYCSGILKFLITNNN